MSRHALRLCWTALWCGMAVLAVLVLVLRRDLADAREEMLRLRQEVERMRSDAAHNAVKR